MEAVKVGAFSGEPLEDSSVELERVRSVPDRVAYPVDALGPIIGPAARGIAERVQAPVELAAQSCLAAASFAAQSLVNVALEGRPRPVSLFLLSEAESGDRKSATDSVATAPLMEHLRQLNQKYKEQREAYENAAAVYEADTKKILSDKKTSSESKEADLRKLQRPIPPPRPVCICEEPTLEGLQKSYIHGLPSQALLSSEGGQFFGGHAMNPDNAMKTVAGLSKFWDGDPIMRTRAAAGESAQLFDRRLSAHLMIQPIVGDKVLTDPLLLQQGILARFLMVAPDSLAGTRLKDPNNHHQRDATAHPAVQAFHARLSALLAQEPALDETNGGGLLLSTLETTPDGYRAWITGYNELEKAQAAGELLEPVKTSASKAHEQALRLAAVMATIEGRDVIDAELVQRGLMLVGYYLQVILRRAKLSEINQEERRVREVLDWIREKAGGKATMAELGKRVTPAKYRRAATLRAIMADAVEAKAARVLSKNSKGKPDSWEVIA